MWNLLQNADSTKINTGDILRFEMSYAQKMTNSPSASDIGTALKSMPGITFGAVKEYKGTGCTIAGKFVGKGPTPLPVIIQALTRLFGLFNSIGGIQVKDSYKWSTNGATSA